MEATTEFINIPATGFAVTNNEATKEYKTVEFNKKALFTFSDFSLIQILLGKQLTETTKYGNKKEVDLLSKIAIFAIESKSTENQASIELNREEISIFRNWLEIRMSHCEEERDSRATNAQGVELFNPDTYIGQKFLLLDIREWLSGEIIG